MASHDEPNQVQPPSFGADREKALTPENAHLENAVPAVGEEDGNITTATILAYIVCFPCPIQFIIIND